MYFSGIVGTIGSLVFGFFIYKSFTLQNKQRIEETLFNYLNAFSKEKDKKQAELIAKELEMFKSVESLNPEEMKTPYFKLLEEYFIVKYSRDSATPRLHIKYPTAKSWILVKSLAKKFDIRPLRSTIKQNKPEEISGNLQKSFKGVDEFPCCQ